MQNRPPSCRPSRCFVPLAVLCLMLAAGPVAAQDEPDPADILDQVVETIEGLLETVVDWVSEGSEGDGETADLGFEIEPNG